jgi:hypothetical protein
MKKLTLIALFFISAISVAQNKFIEVEVTDTIALKPLDFQFNVYVNNEVEVLSYNEDEEYDPKAELEKNKKKLQDIKKMLENKKYKISALNESKPNLFDKKRSGRNGEGFTVLVSGQAEMQKLKDLIDTQPDAKALITVTKYADEQNAEDQLIKKLMDKAKTRVAVIGLNSGLKPGRILEVKEGKQGSDFNIGDFYSQIAKLGAMFGENTGNYMGSLSKTFVVKFAAE